MNLFEIVRNTHDKETFLAFLSSLIDDYSENESKWENQDIGSFLDAIHSWVADYKGDDINFTNPTWKEIAAIFYMGKIYE